ncbi:hypothetical protein [Chryseobacterium turcicum]|uniref:Uncharacterized protein n=1 Tax=Chryseobacterium turcicum TaxID=2898076 RepID=A0A9Q3V5L9_9FLAO|nr:hypothetical protein [Chryseobacterium turcicum]MCD1118637.1 hypothetical protein [Chryseobacterium turcicum]
MLDIGTYMCHLVVKINDVEVFSLNVDGQMSTEIPINMGILESGSQSVEVIGYPVKRKKELEKDSYIRYKVLKYDVSNNQFKLLETLENNYTPPIKTGIPIIAHKSIFEAEVPYKLEAWQNGINLNDANFDVKKLFVTEYTKIVDLINAGRYDEFIDIYKKREINNATSMYLDESDINNRMEKIIDDIKNGFKAMPLSDTVILDLSSEGKLGSLKRSDGYSALYLDNDESDEEIILQIAFYMPEENGELMVI